MSSCCGLMWMVLIFLPWRFQTLAALPSTRVSTKRACPLEQEAKSQEEEELRLMWDKPMSLSGLLPYTCTVNGINAKVTLQRVGSGRKSIGECTNRTLQRWILVSPKYRHAVIDISIHCINNRIKSQNCPFGLKALAGLSILPHTSDTGAWSGTMYLYQGAVVVPETLRHWQIEAYNTSSGVSEQ